MKLSKLVWLKVRIFTWKIMAIPCLMQVQKVFGGISSLTPPEIEQVKNLCAFKLDVEQIVRYMQGVRTIDALKNYLESAGFSRDEIEQLINNYRSNALQGETLEQIAKKINSANSVPKLK